MGGAEAKLYSTSARLKKEALRHNLYLLDAKVRHLGTDRNKGILKNIYDYTKDRVPTIFGVSVTSIQRLARRRFCIACTDDGEEYRCHDMILTGGRSGSRWISEICDDNWY